MADAGQLPRWDLARIVPNPAPPQVDVVGALEARIDAVTTLFDRYRIGNSDNLPPNRTPVAVFDDITGAYNDLLVATQ